MPGRSERQKKKLPAPVRAEQERLVKAFVETFERVWTERPEEDGNTQASTMDRARLSVQAFGKWKRGDADPTIGNLVAIASALDRRIDFTLQSMSDPPARMHVLSDADQGELAVSDDVMNLAEELDKLPDGPKQRIIGHLEGLLSAHRSQRSPPRPDADQRGHGARSTSK